MAVNRYYSSTAQSMSLTGAIGPGDAVVNVNTVAGLPLQTPFTLVLDRGTTAEEIVTVLAVAGNTLTIERGEDGTSAVAHSGGANVRHMLSARDAREPQEHIAATSNVHGVTGDLVGTTSTQTLENKTLAAPVVTSPPANIYRIPGEIVAYGGSSAPSGWLLCDGSAVSRSTYSALFAVISTSFGAGNGTTTFNVPNGKGRVLAGFDSAQAEFDALGETGGEKTHTLTTDEMPSHTHIQDAHTHVQNAHTHTQNAHTHVQDAHNHTQNAHSHSISEPMISGVTGYGQVSPALGNAVNTATGVSTASATAANQATTATNQSTTATNQSATATNQNATATNQSTGGDEAHNNLQPFLVVNYLIKT